jgi:hypothetical protein
MNNGMLMATIHCHLNSTQQSTTKETNQQQQARSTPINIANANGSIGTTLTNRNRMRRDEESNNLLLRNKLLQHNNQQQNKQHYVPVGNNASTGDWCIVAILHNTFVFVVVVVLVCIVVLLCDFQTQSLPSVVA